MSLTKVSSGMVSFTAGSSATVVSKTAAYSAVINDYVKSDATSAAFTVTLPTAVGQSGKTIAIQKTDSTLNIITIATTSSQTINGASTKRCSTQNETLVLVSDGANWLIQSRTYPTVLSSLSLTPASAAFGTVTLGFYRFARRGSSLRIDFRWTNGSATSTAASAALPSGIVIDSSALSSQASGQPIGHWYGVSSSASNILSLNFSGAVIYDGSTTGTVYFSASYVSGAYVKSGGSTVGVSSMPFEGHMEFPVVGWDE
jgi:hypothetical protein